MKGTIMLLTEMELKPIRVEQLHAADNLAKSHQWFARSLYQGTKKPDRYLFRLLQLANGTVKLFLLSQNKPNYKILAKYGRLKTIATKPYQIDLANTKDVNFNLLAAPTYRSKKTHKLMPLTNFKMQKNWLTEKGKINGFKVKHVRVISEQMTSYQHDENSQKIDFKLIEFQGTLTITDKNKFKKALINGIGRNKSYGLGMLLLEPELIK